MADYAKVMHHEESGKSLLVIDGTDERVLKELWHRTNIGISTVKNHSGTVFTHENDSVDNSYAIWEELDAEVEERGLKIE
jgi:hypothetical protein